MSKKVRIIVAVIAVIVLIYSAYQLVTMFLEYRESAQLHEEIRHEVLTDTTEESGPPDVDFDALYAINPDIIGWLWIPDSPISYPILVGETNQTYLRTTYDKKYSVLGSIFQDYRNKPNFEDLNTIIYGHNTRNDSMFGSLKKYKKQDYADTHKDVYILTKEAILKYEAFSIYETPATSDTYVILFENSSSYTQYLEKMTKQSIVPIGTAPVTEHIITLSTCTSNDKSKRLVLQARFVELIPVELAP